MLNEKQLRRMTETLVKQRLAESLKPVFQGVGEMAKTMGETAEEQSDIRLSLLQMVEGSFIELLNEQRKRAKVKVT